MPERIVPFEETMPGVYLPLPIYYVDVPGRWDGHHRWFESDDPQLQGEDQRPLRWSSVQDGPRRLHGRLHENFDKVLFPETESARFQATLLGAMKYIPTQAVDVSGKAPVVRTLEERDINFMDELDAFHIQEDCGWKVGFYFARHIIKYGLEAVAQTEEVARFVNARGGEKRRRSYGVIHAAARVVLSDVEGVYEVGRKTGAIRTPHPSATNFMMWHFNGRQVDHVPSIEEELAKVG